MICLSFWKNKKNKINLVMDLCCIQNKLIKQQIARHLLKKLFNCLQVNKSFDKHLIHQHQYQQHLHHARHHFSTNSIIWLSHENRFKKMDPDFFQLLKQIRVQKIKPFSPPIYFLYISVMLVVCSIKQWT